MIREFKSLKLLYKIGNTNLKLLNVKLLNRRNVS